MTNLHQNSYEMTTQLSNLESEYSNLRASVLEQMTSINEAVEAQTGLLKMHDLNINELQSETKTFSSQTQESFQNLQEKFAKLQTDLDVKAETLRAQFERISGSVTNHEENITCNAARLDKLSMEFRGILQTVDDQVTKLCRL